MQRAASPKLIDMQLVIILTIDISHIDIFLLKISMKFKGSKGS